MQQVQEGEVALRGACSVVGEGLLAGVRLRHPEEAELAVFGLQDLWALIRRNYI